MIKLLITDVKKVTLWGDRCLTYEGYYQNFRGSLIKVKILGLFWVDYKRFILTRQSKGGFTKYCLELASHKASCGLKQ